MSPPCNYLLNVFSILSAAIARVRNHPVQQVLMLYAATFTVDVQVAALFQFFTHNVQHRINHSPHLFNHNAEFIEFPLQIADIFFQNAEIDSHISRFFTDNGSNLIFCQYGFRSGCHYDIAVRNH